MSGNTLQVSVGLYSHKGRKEINQDYQGVSIPGDHLLTTKGIALAIADGISSSAVSQEASQMSVSTFLDDYFATSESWSVQKSAESVIDATNSWLYSRNKDNLYHLEKDKGFVCTFSSLIIKSTTAHIFHLGDARIYHIRDHQSRQLTTDHRVWVSKEQSYLSRALGIDSQIIIDYESIPLQRDDLFVMATDGVYEFVTMEFILETIARYEGDLDMAAKIVIDKAYENGSGDNLTVGLLRIDTLPDKDIKEIHSHLYERPIPAIPEEGSEFDGYHILRKLSSSSRSHVFLAEDMENDHKVVIKIPSIDLQGSEAYLESFLLEEWVAKRLNNNHILRPYTPERKSSYLYTATEYIEGKSLRQWMIDNPRRDIGTVRDIAEQIARGLLAFHRMEMIHQDLRPENIMIDASGTVKIIDFGAVAIKGISEVNTFIEREDMQGTMQYSAPEYFLGEGGTYRSDLYSLGVIVHELLGGSLPYGTKIARTTSRGEQKKLHYHTLYPDRPVWIDETVKKAVAIDPLKRYSELSEFLYDLKNPNAAFMNKKPPSIIEREPDLFWRAVSLVELFIIIMLLTR